MKGPRLLGPISSDDAVASLQDSRKWLALGCLKGQTIIFETPPRDPITFNCLHAETSSDVSGKSTSHSPFCIFQHLEPTFVHRLLLLQSSAWIRIFRHHPSDDPQSLDFLKVFALPFDTGGRYVIRKDPCLQSALVDLVQRLSISQDLWKALDWSASEPSENFDIAATEASGSLFWLFNTIPSPNPRPDDLRDRYAKAAIQELLENKVDTLTATLYPYQRRCAAEMVQREAAPRLHRDPRLEKRTTPDGETYYYDAKQVQFYRDEKYYQACSGGILAETMGLGKTVICIAVILSTFGHLPRVPPQYRPRIDVPSSGARSLLEMAAASIAQHSLPWRQFAGIDLSSTTFPTSGMQAIEQHETYTIPGEPIRFSRRTVYREGCKLQLCSATIVVVPRNLFDQWRSELLKHTEDGFIDHVLLMGDTKKSLPPATELKKYVIILFSRERFEYENRDGYDENGNRRGRRPINCLCPITPGTTKIDCSCRDGLDIYESPLKELHFLRLIIDEGNNFNSVRSNMAIVAEQLVRADRRWIVSGTPARDMLGVEVDLQRTKMDYAESHNAASRLDALNRRQKFDRQSPELSAVSSLGKMATHFLKIPPWARSTEDSADHEDYFYRHESPKRRTYSSFSQCFQDTLKAIVVKTRPDDVERDLQLPPLVHRTVRLEPSYYDRLTVNLFNLVLTSNAVTSERTDIDYLFHPASRKDRMRLVANLRQSFFFWTGFSQSDIQAALRQSRGYLSKDEINCSPEDRVALDIAMIFIETALSSSGWTALSKSHEIGLFVDSFPADIAEHWAFGKSKTPMLIGATQLAQAQGLVNRNIDQGIANPMHNLSEQGSRVLSALHSDPSLSEDDGKIPILAKSGMPASSINGEPAATRRPSVIPRKKQNPSFAKQKPIAASAESPMSAQGEALKTEKTQVESVQPGRKRSFSEISSEENHRPTELDSSSPAAQPRIIGTTSAKLSYLLNEIFKYHHDEKIIIFYEGDNIAYYIAQVLEIFHIEHLIYANSIQSSLRSKWIVRFNEDPSIRILLMDLRQGARGLHASAASRVYFVNPVCRPDVEAQALKRAHRIGQTRPVEVQTLVLKNTMEEAMFDRSQKMTNREHTDAKSLDDDQGIQAIIQQSKPIRLDMDDQRGMGYGEVAPIEEPQQVFGRSGRPRNTGELIKSNVRRERKVGQKQRPSKKERLAKKTKAEGVPSSDAMIVVG